VTFSPDGKQVATASADGTGRLWEVETGKQLLVLEGHEDVVYSIEFSPDGKYLVTGSRDATARIWDGKTGKENFKLIPDENLHSAACSLEYLEEADFFSKEAYEGVREDCKINFQEGVTYAQFVSNGERVMTTLNDNSSKLWNVHDGQQLASFEGGRAQVSADSQRIATLDTKNAKVIISNSTNGEKITSVPLNSQINFDNHKKRLSELNGDAAFSSDGNKVIVRLENLDGGEGCRIEVWDINSAKQVRTSPALGRLCNRLFIFPSSTNILVPLLKQGNSDEDSGATIIWNIESGKIKHLISEGEQEQEVEYVVYSTSENFFVTLGRYDNRLIQWGWEVESKEIILPVHDAPITHVALDPESNLIATASKDNTVHLWDIEPSRLFLEEEECQPVQMEQKETLYSETKYNENFIKSIFEKDEYILNFLKKHSSSINYVTLNRSRSRALINMLGENLYLWDTQSGKLLGTLYGIVNAGERISNAIFNSEETCIQLHLSSDDKLWWRAFPTTQSLIDYARRIVPRQLSCEERRKFGLDIGEQCTDK